MKMKIYEGQDRNQPLLDTLLYMKRVREIGICEKENQL